MKIAVIGGGLQGACCAFALARRGASVTVYDADDGTAASRVPIALINLHRGRQAKSHPEDIEGLEVLRNWEAELSDRGHQVGISWTGVLRVASSPHQAGVFCGHPQARPYENRYRALHLPHGGSFFENGGWVHTTSFLRALEIEARARGVQWRLGVRVRQARETTSEVFLESDVNEGAFDAVVAATGAAEPLWSLPAPLRTVHGLTVKVDVPSQLPSLPLVGRAYAIPTEYGLHLGGLHRVHGELRTEEASSLLREASTFLPYLARSTPLETFCGRRASTPDNRPVFGVCGKRRWFANGLGGRGFLVAPLLAERLARAILRPVVRFGHNPG